jgi:predicted amidohydrolase YtcJ
VIVRKHGSKEPAGLIMGTAYLPVFNNKPMPTAEQELSQLKFAQDLYSSAGVTTAQEGATHATELEALKLAAARNALVIDVVAFPFFLELDPILAKNPTSTWGVRSNRLKIGGCKIVTDGSQQGKTAFFTTPYLTGGPSGEKNWRGEPTVPAEVINAAMKKCYDQGLPVNACQR